MTSTRRSFASHWRAAPEMPGLTQHKDDTWTVNTEHGDIDNYCRQEKNGLLVRFYEQDCKTWGMDGIDPKFVNALCPDDLDRVKDVLEGAFERMPALMDVGIHTIVNGPIT